MRGMGTKNRRYCTMYKKVLYNIANEKNVGGGGGGAIFEPKTLSMYFKKEKEKKKSKKNKQKQELSHDSIARPNCALPITKIRAVA